MYYSKNHKGLVLIDRGMGNLEFSGDGIIAANDIEVWNPDAFNKEEFTAVTFKDGITEIHGGVLEQFKNIEKLILPVSVADIVMTDKLNTLLHANDVLICAAYTSYGDTFAGENNLRFLPDDIELGWYRYEEHDESTKLILQFHENGSMNLLYDIYTVGISAGSNGGAEIAKDMPEGYSPGCTIEQFAQLFPVRYYEQIVRNPEVKAFLKREAERANPDN